MGEIADMMLNGLMCEGCGEFMEDHEEPGYPRRCAGCAPNRRSSPRRRSLPNTGSQDSAFVVSIGAKTVHRVNPATKRSFCQFENNGARADSLAFGAPPPVHYFNERSEKPFLKDCKNCAALAAKAGTT